MRERKEDITQSIISTQDINNKIGSIFPDSAVLDIQFNIVSISQNILEATGYNTNDVTGKSISIFSFGSDFKTTLENQLQSGYFEEQPFEVRCRNGEIIRYRISGFYMGLIADINGLIVLKFTNQEEVNKVNNELAVKTKELDDFVYTSAHSLRGPLATLKGLINLAGATKKQEELNFLVKEMGTFADRLDEKLHQLIYFAESDKTPKAFSQRLTIQSIFQSLSESVRESSFDFPVNFHCPILDKQQIVERGETIFSMLNNLVLFFCQQPKKRENILAIDALSNDSVTEIMIHSKGFLIYDSLIKKIQDVNFGYAEILNYPELINYYAAKKIMSKLDGNVQFMLVASDEVVILMTIPRDQQLSLF